MPKYTFVCNVCQSEVNQFLSIQDFLKTKTIKKSCEFCLIGVLSHQVTSINASVEKSQDQIIMEIKEEASRVVEKIKSGDQKAIEDVYGDRPNPYKN